MIGASDPLDQALDVLGRADLNDKIDIAPVDAEIKASGADNRAQLAAGHRPFDAAALRAVKAAVMDRDGKAVFVGKPQIVKENLRLRAGVVKDQRGLVPLDLIKHCRDRIGGPTARPGRRIGEFQHRNIRGRAGVGQEDFAAISALRKIARKRGRVFDRGRQADATQAGAKRL